MPVLSWEEEKVHICLWRKQNKRFLLSEADYWGRGRDFCWIASLIKFKQNLHIPVLGFLHCPFYQFVQFRYETQKGWKHIEKLAKQQDARKMQKSVQREVGKLSKGGGSVWYTILFQTLWKLALSTFCNFYSNWQSGNLFQSYQILQDIYHKKVEIY